MGVEYRRRGIGRALVKAAASVYPELRYCCLLHKSNTLSVATAASAGFTLAGVLRNME